MSQNQLNLFWRCRFIILDMELYPWKMVYSVVFEECYGYVTFGKTFNYEEHLHKTNVVWKTSILKSFEFKLVRKALNDCNKSMIY